MSKLVEFRTFSESLEDKADRLTRQLREATLRADRAFEQGAAMVIRALRSGADLEDIAKKVRWDLVDPPARARAVTVEIPPAPIPMEMSDSNEHTEPVLMIPRYPRARTEPGH